LHSELTLRMSSSMPRGTLAAIVVLVAGMLVGCASGPLAGQFTAPGQPPQPVALHYKSSLFGGGGQLSTTLPSGERFTGRYVLVPLAPDHQMASTLTGNRGSLLVCRFRLDEPGVGPDGGGTGSCELSTGGTIVLQF
jgi:hypothetical protein